MQARVQNSFLHISAVWQEFFDYILSKLHKIPLLHSLNLHISFNLYENSEQSGLSPAIGGQSESHHHSCTCAAILLL